jgi:CRISPR-associated protein Csd1
VLLGLDSALSEGGRLAITYYRKLENSEYLSRIEKWHTAFAWIQNYCNEKGRKFPRFIGAPAPEDIAWAAYCNERITTSGALDYKLLVSTVERILPCIIDGIPFPPDIVRSVISRVSNRMGLKADKEKGNKWIYWEKCLGIACALYKGTHAEKEYKMALEDNRLTRDYLYGRLLAVADCAESIALNIAKENRDTNAINLMQRFASQPFATWKTLEESLKIYMKRIKASYYGLWEGYDELLDIILNDKFKPSDYMCNDPLTGEYLLGYHCQRRWLKTHKRKDGKWVEKPRNVDKKEAPDNSGVDNTFLEGEDDVD